jgi:hypothetical protein
MAIDPFLWLNGPFCKSGQPFKKILRCLVCIWRVYPVGTHRVSGPGGETKVAPDLGLLLLGDFSQNIFVLFSKFVYFSQKFLLNILEIFGKFVFL